MNRNSKASWLRSILAFCLTLTVLVASSSVALARVENALAGEIVISENDYVLLNGERALNGRTFFSSGVIATENSGATIKLEKLGHITLSPNTVIALNFSDKNISGKVTSGDVQIFNNDGVAVNVEKIENGKTTKVPSAQQNDDDDDDGAWVPILVFAGVVGTAVLLVLVNRDDDGIVSPVR